MVMGNAMVGNIQGLFGFVWVFFVFVLFGFFVLFLVGVSSCIFLSCFSPVAIFATCEKPSYTEVLMESP